MARQRSRDASRQRAVRGAVTGGHLRIVSDSEWDAAHERMGTSRENYLRPTDGRLWAKPASGVESKYLPRRVSLCAECGGGLQVYSRAHGRRRAYFYGCPRARVARCGNDLLVPMEIADDATIAIMTEDVLSAEGLSGRS
jgi:hypothetical protein